MRCSSCETVNPGGARFCVSCGAPLTRECPACGAQVEPEWRFCAGCGGALEEAAPTQSSSPRSYTPAHLAERILGSRSLLEGERKRVTILFADLKGSTELISNLDPEDARGLLDPPLESMMDAVHRFEGTVNRVQGDGLMAMFGAPLAHEDHALRACHAAIEMRRAIGDMAPESAVPIELRVGLHSGEVVVRAIHNDLSMSYDAVGLAAHLAARMEQIAAPGEIRMTAQTLRAVEGFVEATALGTTEIKGLTQPMETYALRSTTTARTRVEATEPRGLTPFVGRRRDLEALQAAFESAGRGEGRAVFVSGEPGIGKSRLMLEFRRQVADSATWLEGHSLSFGQAMPLYPVIDLLRGNFGIDEDDDELGVIEKIRGGISRVGKDLEPLIPHFRHLMNVDPGDALVTGMDPQLRRAELFDALRRLLLGASAIRPQVILFEDLHWVDPATEALLEFIANSIPTARILCVFTYRPGYRHPFGERTFHVHLSLSSLSGSDAASMAEGMLQAHHLPDGLQQLLLDKVEGNPFYLEEVVKSLQESGAIEHRSGGFVLTRPLDQIDVPDTIQGVIMARIDRLAEAPRTTLQLASVIGREFTERLLKRIRDFDDPANVVLEELKAIELVYEKTLFPELAYMFKHALTQDVAYGSLLSERRRELHGTIGRAIEELYRERLAEHYEMLAYHYERAEEWARAAQWFHRAAAKAAGSFANREALTLYERAIAAMRLLGEAADKTELAELNKSLAWVQFAAERDARLHRFGSGSGSARGGVRRRQARGRGPGGACNGPPARLA